MVAPAVDLDPLIWAIPSDIVERAGHRQAQLHRRGGLGPHRRILVEEDSLWANG